MKLSLLYNIRNYILRKKLIMLLSDRDYFSKKVTIDDNVLDNIQDFDLDRLENMEDEKASKVKSYDSSIKLLLDKMASYRCNIDDLINKYPSLNRIIYSDEDLSLKFRK